MGSGIWKGLRAGSPRRRPWLLGAAGVVVETTVAVLEPGTDGKKSEMGCLGMPTPLGCEVDIGGGRWEGNRRSTMLLVQWRGHQP
jgi:hypothetical protein